MTNLIIKRETGTGSQGDPIRTRYMASNFSFTCYYQDGDWNKEPKVYKSEKAATKAAIKQLYLGGISVEEV